LPKILSAGHPTAHSHRSAVDCSVLAHERPERVNADKAAYLRIQAPYVSQEDVLNRRFAIGDVALCVPPRCQCTRP
jgi:hypothetical protein